jgi:hypothetical protein
VRAALRDIALEGVGGVERLAQRFAYVMGTLGELPSIRVAVAALFPKGL